MTIRRVGVIFDNQARPETTGGYCLSAFQHLAEAVHLHPGKLDRVTPQDFDLFVRIDDGLEFEAPDRLRPLAWWAIDTHLDFERCLRQAKKADLTFAAQKPGAEAMRASGVAAEWLPLACDPDIHIRHELTKRWDFAFVGHVFPGPRAELLAILAKQFPSHFIGQAYFDAMARAYSEARTVFNRSIRNDVNMRVFEGLACGSLLVTNDLPESGQSELFRDGFHLATYGDRDELLDKLAYYLSRPAVRSRIEDAGRQIVLEFHTYRKRMEKILNAVQNLPSINPTASPTARSSSSYDPGYFEFDRPELLAQIPGEAKSILDVGCGAGRLGEQLKQRQQARVTGLEFDPSAAKAARSRLDEVWEGDVESPSLSFAGQSFDAVVCGDVLEHLRDPLAFLRRVQTWLKPDGRLIASIPNVRHHSVVRSLLAGDWTYESAGLLDRTHLRFFTRREVEKLLFRAGFETGLVAPLPGPGHAEWVADGRPGQVRVRGLQIGPLSAAEAEEFYTYQWLAVARPARSIDWGLTSVVIPVHNELNYTRLCLDSLRLVTDEPFEVIVVDNGSSDGTSGYLRSLAASDGRIRVITNPTNRGFAAAVNQGMIAAAGRQILLLNNDTILPTGWLRRLLSALNSDVKVGLVGPCSNNVSGEQQINVTYDDLAGIDGFAWEWGHSNAGRLADTDRLVGFCLLTRREVIDRIGLLDEQFGLGCYEDDDFCLRARRAGFRAVIARDAFVHHFGSRTFAGGGIDLGALMRQNQRKFLSKWEEPSSRTTSSPRPVLGSETGLALRAGPSGGLLLEQAIILSVCLIVRDNRSTIGPCLESIRPWVDEMVVVDTGSQDDTPAMAASLGARVFHFPWCDDFSAARNESVRHARGRWVFWMDSDDTIDDQNGRELRALACSDHAEDMLGFVVQVHCPGPGKKGEENMTVVDHVKLFRNRPELRFEGRIHEQILPAIRRAGGEVAWTSLFVVHSGYDHSPSGQKRKIERDLRLLHLEQAERPDHPFTLFNLGMTYADIGEHAKAIEHLTRSIGRAGPGESHLRKAHSLLAHCEHRAGKTDAALETCERGLRLFPDDLELEFRHGVLLHATGNLAEAAAAYERVLNRPRDRYFTSVDRGISGFKARQNLALAWAERGEHARAESEWRQIIGEVPEYSAGWRGLGESLAAQQNHAALTETLAQMKTINGLDGDVSLLEGLVSWIGGDQGRARSKWEQASCQMPDDPEPLRKLGRACFEAGDDEQTEDVLTKLVRLDPGDAAAWHNLGIVQLRSGKMTEAIASFRTSLDLRPQAAETRLNLARTLEDIGDVAAAEHERSLAGSRS
ncbi:glycosyltransferase [Zavarzinella formosa]|uniref:glycosyltransferase n=1 Tax=Zavarzinella formosa TaxID=360055 RepID=UPI0003679BC2|nr:glycosyltransferase [Zavarzinella formosa]